MNTIWQDRWQALEKQLQEMAARYGRSPNLEKADTLQALTESLLAFGQDQFSYFWEGFRSGQLLPAMMLPQDHVFRATLDQVAFDMAIIQRIASQRQQPEHQKTLAQADQLAQAALNVAVDSGLLRQCGVLTYFNKSANIRLIPYAPLALVGVPFSATTTDMDFLAIPHEVGHFVYHHAPGLAAALHARIPLYPNWINRWIEEIFADVYGALVAGPVIGLSFQHILADNAQEKFVADDGIHPPDAIRPYTYSTVPAPPQLSPTPPTPWTTRGRNDWPSGTSPPSSSRTTPPTPPPWPMPRCCWKVRPLTSSPTCGKSGR
jgi:hypothetical protein